MTAEQKAELLSLLNEKEETVVEELETVQTEDTQTEVIEAKEDVVEVVVEEAKTVEETINQMLELVKVREEYEVKLQERDTKLSATLDELKSTFTQQIEKVVQESTQTIKALQEQVAELKRTSPMPFMQPKANETTVTKEAESRDDLVAAYRSGYKNKNIN